MVDEMTYAAETKYARGDVVEVEGRYGIVLRDHVDDETSRPFWEVLVGTDKVWYTPNGSPTWPHWRRTRLSDGFPYVSVSGTGKVLPDGTVVDIKMNMIK